MAIEQLGGSQRERRLFARRALAAQSDRQSAPETPGWELLARRSQLPREQVLPAEQRLARELRGRISEGYDGSLGFRPIKELSTRPERWTWEISRVYGNPFKRVDALGEPGIHPMRIHSVYSNFRDSLRYVRDPHPEPRPPGWIGFGLSVIPITSTFQDLAALADVGSLIANVPVLNRMPFVRKIVPTPGAITRDVGTIVSDVAKIAGVGLVLPGSVYANRNADYKSTRIVETYLPQVARRELESATPAAISPQGARIFRGIERMIRTRPNEIVETQNEVMRLLNVTLGQRDEDASQQPAYNLVSSRSVFGFFGRLRARNEVLHDLTQSETQRIQEALDAGKIGIKQVTRLMTGLDALATVHHTLRLRREINEQIKRR